MRRAYEDGQQQEQDGRNDRQGRFGSHRTDALDGRSSRLYGDSGRDERAESSGSRIRKSEQSTDPEEEEGRRRRRQQRREDKGRQRRSHSPYDFARDRAREREAYDRKHSAHVDDQADAEQVDKRKTEPNFGASGLLAKESNSKNGVTLKYFEPPEGRKPKKKWRLYVFKDGKETDVLHIAQQSCYLLGRDHAVADIPVDHASISKQHAVIQYRSITSRNEYGDEKHSIKPFLIDLDSANGSFVNAKEVPSSRYYELRNGDTITLGGSEREYVLLMED